ncbi:MAG: DUF2868 domain-containing protein [Rhodocyclales bacterium]|nr:DUF2868 domain-containing protein [Rhodocyclales bacterium]
MGSSESVDDLSEFEARWLAEAMRLHGQGYPVVEDEQAVRFACAAARDVEQRICWRARWLGARNGMLAVLVAWRARAAWAMALLALVAALSGAGAALAVLGDGGRPANVAWVLGSLLGAHFASLAAWFALMWVRGRESGGVVGRCWLWLTARMAGRGVSPRIAQALTGLLERAGALRWLLGAISHGVWLVALLAAVAGLLVALSLRRYGFVWETTILPAEVFVRFVEVSGWLPGVLGFATPDADAVRLSGVEAVADGAVRRVWASWLIGCVVAYGILPRALAWLVCIALFRLGQRRVRLDLNLPAYAMLVHRLAPMGERIGIIDPAPSGLPHAHVRGRHPVQGHAALLVGLELRDDIDWPPPLPATVRDGGVVDSRAQRQGLVARLAADPPQRLLIACDPRLSPDRGSLEYIAELSRHAGTCRVWLAGAGSQVESARTGYWREALLELGLPRHDIMERRDAALGWLEGASS